MRKLTNEKYLLSDCPKSIDMYRYKNIWCLHFNKDICRISNKIKHCIHLPGIRLKLILDLQFLELSTKVWYARCDMEKNLIDFVKFVFFSYRKISWDEFSKFYFRLVETSKLSLEYKRLITILELAPLILILLSMGKIFWMNKKKDFCNFALNQYDKTVYMYQMPTQARANDCTSQTYDNIGVCVRMRMHVIYFLYLRYNSISFWYVKEDWLVRSNAGQIDWHLQILMKKSYTIKRKNYQAKHYC